MQVSLSRFLGATSYMECSAKTRAGLKELFAEAAKTALEEGKGKNKGGGGGIFGAKCQLL